jgi:flagellar FliL protein
VSDEVTSEELEDLEDIEELAKGSSKKKMLVIVGLLFVVCNIGWGAAFLFSDKGAAEAAAPPTEGAQADSPDGPAGDEAPAGDEEESVDKADKARKTGPMLKLDPFVVNLDEPRGSHYLRVAIELEVKDEDTLAQVEERMVVLRDRFISALSSKRLADLTRPQDKEALRDELLDLSREATGKRMVQGVYFTEFLTQ